MVEEVKYYESMYTQVIKGSIIEGTETWFIHLGSSRWLARDADEKVRSDGANKIGWRGYYYSLEDAVERLKRFRLGLTPSTTIYLGGE